MTDETPTAAPVVNPEPETPAGKGAIPYDRFSEVVAQKNELATQLSAIQEQLNSIEAEKQAAIEAKRLKSGEAESVINELKSELGTYKTQAEEFQKMQAQRLDSLRNKLPEDKRDKYAHITDLGLMETLVEDLSTTGGGAPPDRSGVPKDDFNGYGSLTEWANKDLKSFSAYMAKENTQSIKWGQVPE